MTKIFTDEVFAFKVGYLCYLSISRILSQQDITGDLIGLQRNETSVQAVFREVYINMVLNVTPIAIFKGMDVLKSSLSCLSEPKCVAYNMRITELECCLLDRDRSRLLELIVFVPKSGWSYYDTGSEFNIKDNFWRKVPLVGKANKYGNCVKKFRLHISLCEEK